jgi:hypothetical protein
VCYVATRCYLDCFSSPRLLLLLLMLLCRYISLLRLLRLGRAYRLYGWVQNLTYNQTLSLMAVTLARNFAVSWSLRYMVRNVPASHICCSSSFAQECSTT